MREIGALIDSGAIRPVVDRVFQFGSTKEALAYVEQGRAKGKVIVKVHCRDRGRIGRAAAGAWLHVGEFR